VSQPMAEAPPLPPAGSPGAWVLAMRPRTLVTSLVPVLVGSGIPLFGAGVPAQDMRLIGSRRYPNGCVRVDYALATATRPPARGRRGRTSRKRGRGG